MCFIPSGDITFFRFLELRFYLYPSSQFLSRNYFSFQNFFFFSFFLFRTFFLFSFFFFFLPLSKIVAKYIKITLGHFVIAFKKIWEKWKMVRYHDWIAFNGIKIVSRWKRFISLDLRKRRNYYFFFLHFFFIIIWVICSMFSLYFMSHFRPLVFFVPSLRHLLIKIGPKIIRL